MISLEENKTFKKIDNFKLIPPELNTLQKQEEFLGGFKSPCQCNIDYKIAKLELKKGDILCVNVKDSLDNVKLESFKRFLQKAIPKDIKVILIMGDIELTIIHKDDK